MRVSGSFFLRGLFGRALACLVEWFVCLRRLFHEQFLGQGDGRTLLEINNSCARIIGTKEAGKSKNRLELKRRRGTVGKTFLRNRVKNAESGSCSPTKGH